MIHLQCTHYSIFKTQFTHVIPVTYVQCFDAAGWASERASGMENLLHKSKSFAFSRSGQGKLEVTPEK